MALREQDYDTYHHVYEGATRSTVEGAIYKARRYRQRRKRGRIQSDCHLTIPCSQWDTFWDLGFADRVSIWSAQRTPFEIKVIRYCKGDHQAD